MSDIEFDCPECSSHLVVDSAGAGKVVNCPDCSKQIKIPATQKPTRVFVETHQHPQGVTPASMIQPTGQEEIVYSDEAVSITTARVVISGTTYAMRNITSVRMARTPAKVGPGIILLIFGIVGLLLARMYFSDQNARAGLVALLLAVVLIAGGILLICVAKARYHVSLSSSSGESDALTSKDRGYIEKVVMGINDAIVRHG